MESDISERVRKIEQKVGKIQWELQEQTFEVVEKLGNLSAEIVNLKDVVNKPGNVGEKVEKDSGRKLHYYFIGRVDFHSLLASYLSEKEVKSLSDTFTSVCAREDKTPENFARYVKVVDKESFLVEPDALFVW